MKFINKINYSSLEKNKWYAITLIRPDENCKIINIPHSGRFLIYTAFLTNLGKDHVFTIALPFCKFNGYIMSLPRHMREVKGKNVSFEIMKLNMGKMDFKGWKVI